MMAITNTGNIVLPFSSGTTGTGTDAIDPAYKNARIGYETVLTTANVTASSEAAGYPVTNIVNPLTAHRWKPTALPATVTCTLDAGEECQYMGIAGHTIGSTGCSVEFLYSVNNGSSWNVLKKITPADNKPLMIVFSQLARYWRIRITRDATSEETAMPSVGVFMTGRALEMQRGLYVGHTPITLARKTQRITNKTEGGQYAGNSVITEGVSTSFEWKNLTAQWYREKFDPFVVYARSRPFFIAWRYAEFPLEVGFVWTTDDIRPTNSGPRDLMSVSMSVDGYSDE